MWVATFKVLDSQGKRNLKSTSLPLVKTNSSPVMAALDLHISSFSSRPSANQKEGVQEEVVAHQHVFCWGWVTGGFWGHLACHTQGHFGPLSLAEFKQYRKWHPPCDLLTSLQLQSTACCSPGRWSSSKPIAGGPITPEFVYLVEKRSKWWTNSQNHISRPKNW